MLYLFCLKLNTKLRKQVWLTSFWGIRATWERNTASNNCQLARVLTFRPWYQRSGLSCDWVWNMTSVSVACLFWSVYVCPLTAKFGFLINSVTSSCLLSSLTSWPEKRNIISWRNVAILGKNETGGRVGEIR